MKTLKIQQTIINDFARLWENNPIDNPTNKLLIEDYRSLLRAMLNMPTLASMKLNKANREWDYFTLQWTTLYEWRRVDMSADELTTYYDVYDCILGNWDTYTYRCVASLIRMLGEE